MRMWIRQGASRCVGPKVIGYVRVSTHDQGIDGAGIEAQRSAIVAEADRHGWQLLEVVAEVGSGAALKGRPQLVAVLERLRRGEADALVVAKLDRLTRSVIDAEAILERRTREGWRLVVVDLGVDTSTAAGEEAVRAMATFAQLERRMISTRVREALAVKRAQGVRLGRPLSLPLPTRSRIRAMREGGMTFASIANALNAEGVPTAQGGRHWWPSSVRAVLAANTKADWYTT